jgi:uncharacterized protein DUF3617
MKFSPIVFAIASTFGPFLAVAQNINLKPGKYETTGEVTMSGSPIKMPPVKNVECMTETDLRAFAEKRTADTGHCKISDLRLSGNKASYTVTCTSNGRTTTGKSEWTFESDSFQHVLETTTSRGTTMTTRIVGKRIGECTK